MRAKAKRSMVAIVGRPNVGKSTLFNRLMGRKLAIVEDSPGVTRDRHYADTELDDRPITLIDTGGFVPGEEKDAAKVTAQVRLQAQAAVEECDLVLFVVDSRIGLTAADEEVARFLRRAQRPILLVVNKADDTRQLEVAAADFHRLGLGEPHPVSAEHNRGIEALREEMLKHLPVPPEVVEGAEEEDGAIRVAIVGRPNVGKSTLVNALLNEERLITSDVAGTTRDPIDSELEWQGQRFVLTDTAGIRRKSAISQKIEQFSVFGALRSIELCDVAVLMLDAEEPAVDQDARIASIAEEKGKPLLIAINKWDLVREKKKEEEMRADLKHTLKWVAYAPMIFIAAKDKLRVQKVLELTKKLHAQTTYRAPTGQLNRLLEHVTTEHPLPFENGKALRMYYCAQVSTQPPTFTFMCNRPGGIPDRYKRYLVNQLRETFELNVPVRLLFRERPGKAKRAERARTFKARSRSRARR